MSALLLRNVSYIRVIFSRTALIQQRIERISLINRFLSSNNEIRSTKSASKFKDTVLLPKTEFPLWLDSRLRDKYEKEILEKCRFSSLYDWQRENIKGKEFVLHDGPPYANGSPHVGHAVNKILKDIIMRNELLNGSCIHYVPGWDCHGLPIEQKAVTDQDSQDSLQPLQIRQRARKFAAEAVEIQKSIFRSWGILGNWDSKCYLTYDKSYVKNQLQRFYTLVEKGLVYRDMKPIYWSPSSRTALAEAELQYNKHHKSTCVTLRVGLLTKPFNVDIEGPLYALVWTTTPWTLPANEAVTYRSDIEYSIVRIENLDGHYILASKLVPELEEKLSKQVTTVQTISGKSLKRATYNHPIYKSEVHKFFHASHVTDDKGTGLVHCAPSHGREDYIVAVENKLKLVSLVDKEGKYVETAGTELVGKSILDDGGKAVQDILKTDIIHTEDLVHSYPYDWRTNKPVFLLASEQWFFDCSSVRDDAVASLETVAFVPDDCHRKLMTKLVKERPFWCISRQRAWGVPIPVLFKRDCKDAIITKELVDHYCDLIDNHGSDFWWTLPIEELCPQSLAAKLNIENQELERCHDILDIWFDSGLSWSAVLDGRIADLYLEGSDQLTGWFQSSLLTSVALSGRAPYKKILTHGFVVDENRLKMSKSLGNVIEPDTITKGGRNKQKEPPFGVDTLRWWVAAHSIQHANIPISTSLIKQSFETVQKLRGTMRFALGVLHDFPPQLTLNFPLKHLSVLDKYMLHVAASLKSEVEEHYTHHRYNLICSTINNYVVNDVSGLYFTLTKDRLFCDSAESKKRRAAQFVVYQVMEIILKLIAPITPLLAEEVYTYHPLHTGRRFYEYRSKNPLQILNDSDKTDCESSIRTALQVKSLLNKSSVGKLLWAYKAVVKCSPQNFDALKVLVENQPESISELTEILQVGSVVLEAVPEDLAASFEEEFEVDLQPLNTTICGRCRRFTVVEDSDICTRCMDVLDSPLKSLKHSPL